MRAWAIVESGKPLQCIELERPKPVGTEVLVEVTHCGICHSDLHLRSGSYNMGGGQVLRVSDRGVTLPRAPGHEPLGRVAELGPDAKGVAIGDRRIVYPWIGCGHCSWCREGLDNLCPDQQIIGVLKHGGFADYVLVPHPRYLVDFGNVDPALAATYTCSGITVYGAIKKALPLAPDVPIVLIGAGGLGLSAIAMLKAFEHRNIISVDLAPEKRAAALAMGATQVVDGTSADLAAAIVAAAGGPVRAVIDFVNITSTAKAGFEALVRGGKLILVGVSGGEMMLSLAGMVFQSKSVIGTVTGSLAELHAVVKLAQDGKLPPFPIKEVARAQTGEVFEALERGEVVGRIVLRQ